MKCSKKMLTRINNIKKIGVISDTHIPNSIRQLPAKLFKVFKDVQLIIHCGDITTEEVLMELGQIAPTEAVKGNMDTHLTLPKQTHLEINGKYIICATHPGGSHNAAIQTAYKLFKDSNPYMILFGHTHTPFSGLYNGVKMFNPGSCASGTVGILTVGLKEIKSKIVSVK